MGVLMKIVGVMIMIFSILLGIGGFLNTVFVSNPAVSLDGSYAAGRTIGAFIGVMLFAGPMFGLGLIIFNLPGYVRKQIARLSVARTFD